MGPQKRGGSLVLRPLIAVLVVSASVQLTGAEGSSGTAATTAGRIVFASAAPGNFDIFSVEPDNSGLLNLTNSPDQEWDPELSPDGMRIAFSRRRVGSNSADIWTMRVDGSGQQRLIRELGGPIDRDPAWSPNGSRIAWTRTVGGINSSQVWTMEADGSGRTRLTSVVPGRYDHSPVWSPDGSQIAFVSSRGGGFPDLWVMSRNGADQERLTSSPGADASPDWHGTRIAYECRPPRGQSSVCIMETAPGSGTRLPGGPGQEAQPTWSPDGSSIAAVAYPARGGDKDIIIMDDSGAVTGLLGTGPSIDIDPSWGVSTGAAPMAPRSTVQDHGEDAAMPSERVPVRTGLRTSRARRIAPGVRYTTGRFDHSDIHVVRVDPRRRATIDTALSQNRLVGRERTSRMARRHRAIVAINGDFPLLDGRPSQPFAEDGDLKTTSFAHSHNFAVSADERHEYMDHPVETIMVREASSGDPWMLDRWNLDPPTPAEIAVYSKPGEGLERPPRLACSARLEPLSGRRWSEGRASVNRRFEVEAARCRARRMSLQGGVVISAQPGTDGAILIDSLSRGERITLAWSMFGWRGVADTMGGWPVLVHEDRIVLEECHTAFCQRQPRTGVGITSRGKILLVVADGRRSSSRGLSLQQFATLFRSLGAVEALNFDGGGSSTMVVRGRVKNRPAAGFERSVCCALLVLPGRDRRERIAAPSSNLSSFALSERDAATSSLLDPGSTGGMLDAMAKGFFGADTPLPLDFRSALRVYRSSRHPLSG